MTEYAKNKELTRGKAIAYQEKASRENLSYLEIFLAQRRFEKLGKRYGLIREFRENGIL